MLLMAFDNEFILRDAETGLMINHESGSTDIYTGEGSVRATEILVFDENLPLFNAILLVTLTPDGQLAAALAAQIPASPGRL